jgi:anthranilate phosphoribosyltransferase
VFCFFWIFFFHLQVTATSICEYDISAASFGLSSHSLDAVSGGSPADRANTFREVLEGKKGPYRDFIVMNAAAGLYACGLANDWKNAAEKVQSSLDSGAAKATTEHYIRLTQSMASLAPTTSALAPTHPADK